MRLNPLTYGLAGLRQALYRGDAANAGAAGSLAASPGGEHLLRGRHDSASPARSPAGEFRRIYKMATEPFNRRPLGRGGAARSRLTASRRSSRRSCGAYSCSAMVGVVGTGLWAALPRHGRARSGRSFGVRPGAVRRGRRFRLTDQDGKPFVQRRAQGQDVGRGLHLHELPRRLSDDDACSMAKLQKTLARPDVHFVSFSVDPERDTPAVLKQYAKNFDADASRWHFLTGDKAAPVPGRARDMKLTAEPAGVLGPRSPTRRNSCSSTAKAACAAPTTARTTTT